jgi:hypothetical protein
MIWLSSSAMKAQEYKIPVENPKESVLSLEGFGGDIAIEGYAGNDIIFSSSGEDYQVPERARGLKPVYPGGTDNTGIGLSVEKSGNQTHVVCLIPFTQHAEYRVRVPEYMSIKVQSQCEYSSDISISKMKNEIEIQTCHGISLKDVSGPLVLSTISGDIEINFGVISVDKPVSVNSISGEIDITLPVKSAADIELQTVTGTMYSDFDFSDNSKEMNRIGGNQLNYKLNGGGTRLSIVTVSSNIYLRKGL